MARRDVAGMIVLELLMDPSQAQLGGLASRDLEVNGQRSIMVLDPSLLSMSKPSLLSYYRGAVKSGTLDARQDACNATIFKFDEPDSASELYNQLTQVDHPCVMKTLGIANGLGEQINSSFLALLPFDTTFATYLEGNGPGVDENGRFTEDFITLISDIIDGLEELHSLGYYCPDLKGDDIAVIKQSGSISAKIWKFKKCDTGMEEEQKDGDWLRLGTRIVGVRCTKDASNLMKRIKKGQLKGKSIKKHSALLTVRKKFENVLAFYLHLSLNYPQKQTQNNNALEASKLCAANLENDLDRILSWTTPAWTHSRRGFPISTKTLRGFVNQLRIFIEHEIFFIPEEMTRPLTINEKQDGKKVKDLEQYLQDQDSCGVIFRAVQRLVAELNLEL